MYSQDAALLTVSGVKVVRLGFLSHDGVSQIKALMWTPAEGGNTTPKAIIHIAHGMEEYIGRYVGFANYLASLGFVVCAADMVGHGASVADSTSLGCIPLEGSARESSLPGSSLPESSARKDSARKSDIRKSGATILVEDIHELRKIVAMRFSQRTPYLVFGHSMGSFIMREYVAAHGEGITGAILCGSGQQPLLLSKVGGFLAKRIAKAKGENYKSSFLEGLGAGAYAKKIKNARTPYDWICTDETVVDAYAADPLCGVPFSAGGYVALTNLTAKIATKTNAAKVPKGLPVLFVAGANDPVGNNGVGVQKAAALLRRAGLKRVDVVLYEGMRHEILNEPEKMKVYADILQWIDSILGAS